MRNGIDLDAPTLYVMFREAERAQREDPPPAHRGLIAAALLAWVLLTFLSWSIFA